MRRCSYLSSLTFLSALFICSLSTAQQARAETCVPPPGELISWWAGDGNANDIAGTNHGTLENNAGLAPGLVGQAFSFSGPSGFLQ